MLVLDTRTAHDFLKEWEGKTGDALGQDITATGTNFLNPNTIRILKDKGFAGAAIKFMIDKMKMYAYQSDVLYQKMKEATKPYDDLPNRSKLKVFGVMSYFDSPQGTARLKNQGLQWPTDQMLRHHGLDDSQVAAAKAIFKFEDIAYSLENQRFMKRNGGSQLERKPGHMPHFHDGGPYKVFLQSRNGGDEIIRVQGFKTRYFANKYAQKMLSQGFRVAADPQTKELVRVNKYDDINDSLITNYQQVAKTWFNLEKLGSAGIAEIQRVEDAFMKDQGKHQLERSGVKGFTGEFSGKPDPESGVWTKLAYHVFKYSPALKIYDRYAKNVAEGWKNDMFLSDVFHPLMNTDAGYMSGNLHGGALFEKLPNAANYIRRLGYNFIGKNINNFYMLDNAIRDFSVALGVDPHMYRTFARSARNFLSLVKLRINPANTLNNAVQPVHMLSWLMYTDQRYGMSGKPLKAFAKVTGKNFRPDSDARAALIWMREMRGLAPQLDSELGVKMDGRMSKTLHTLTLGHVNPFVEQFGRTTSFLVAFEHYKDVFNGDVVKAREAAMLATEQIMVNYDRTNRPLMYQNFGVLGELASPFAVFRNAYIGNTYLMTKMMVKAVRENPKNIKFYAPWLAMQATYLTLAGALGMVGVSEYNAIADTINSVTGEETMLRAEDAMFKYGWSDGAIFGLPSNALKMVPGLEEGAYIGGSGSAIGLDDLTSSAMAPFLKALFSLGGLTINAAKSTISDAAPPSLSDVYKAGRQFIPGVFMGHYEKAFQGEGTDVALKSSAVEAATERTKAGERAVMFTGRTSIPEYRRRSVERAVERGSSLEARQRTKLVEQAADLAEGKPTMWTSDKILKRADELGLPPEELSEKVVEEINRRRVPARTRDAINAAEGNESALRRMRRREELE
jgi:hypothetical protein